MMLSSAGGHSEVVGQLLAKGADVQAQAENGATALMFAIGLGHSEGVGQLLAKRETLAAYSSIYPNDRASLNVDSATSQFLWTSFSHSIFGVPAPEYLPSRQSVQVLGPV